MGYAGAASLGGSGLTFHRSGAGLLGSARFLIGADVAREATESPVRSAAAGPGAAGLRPGRPRFMPGGRLGRTGRRGGRWAETSPATIQNNPKTRDARMNTARRIVRRQPPMTMSHRCSSPGHFEAR